MPLTGVHNWYRYMYIVLYKYVIILGVTPETRFQWYITQIVSIHDRQREYFLYEGKGKIDHFIFTNEVNEIMWVIWFS